MAYEPIKGSTSAKVGGRIEIQKAGEGDEVKGINADRSRQGAPFYIPHPTVSRRWNLTGVYRRDDHVVGMCMATALTRNSGSAVCRQEGIP